MMAAILILTLISLLLPMAEAAASLPVLWLAQTTLLGEKAALFRAGPVDLTPADLALLVLLLKLVVTIVRTGEFRGDPLLYGALALFILVNAFATLVAGVKFGETPMTRGLTALARLASEAMLVPMLACGIRSVPQARRCARLVLGLLAVLVFIQFVNFVGASRGLIIGEVQGIERGEVRYFGPVGDSVGAVLTLGYLWALCLPTFVGIGAYAGGIVLTAGLGAVTAMAVGTGFFAIFGAHTAAVRRFLARSLWLVPVLIFGLVVAVLTVGQPLARTLSDRLSGGNYSTSASQRLANVDTALAMIADNPLTGVGFAGYEPALARYGGERYFDLAKSDGATANANNQILQALTDAGAPGLLVFVVLVATAGRLLRRAGQCADRTLATYFLAVFLWLLAMIFGNLAAVWLVPSSYVARLLWISLGIAGGTVALLEKSPGAEPPEDPVQPALATA